MFRKIIFVFLFFLLLFPLNLFLPSPVHADSGPIYWGALIKGTQYGLPDPPYDMRAVDVFESHTGKKVSIIHFGTAWYSNGTPQAFPTQYMNNIRNHGSIPLFSWSSRDSSGDKTNQPNFKSSLVTSGIYDDYITAWATAARDWGQPFFLRFDWEMNGWWYPWAEGSPGTTGVITNGNQPGDYVAMWKHVHDIFTSVGATNVTWLWCINQMSNTNSGQHPPMTQIYPGDNYVDWTGFDNYNRYSGWLDFNPMITGSGTSWLLNTYQATLNVAPSKPIFLAEWGSKEDLSNSQHKANWFTDALGTQLPNNFPAIKAVTYFNWNTTSDLSNPDGTISIESSPQSQSAFASAISSPYYATNTFGILPPGPVQPLLSTPTVPPPPILTANLVQNPSFENTGKSWLAPWVLTVKTGATGTISQDNSTSADATYSAKIATSATGGTWYNVSLEQKGLTFLSGKTYQLSLWAKSSANRTSHVIVQQNYSPYTEYTKQIINLTPSWQKYTLSFTSPVSDTNLKLNISAADSLGSVWFDNFSLTQTN